MKFNTSKSLNQSKVIITNFGFKTHSGIYIGRGSKFGNPFPTKKSKYSNKIYSLKESLRLYNSYFLQNIKNSIEWKNLIEEFRKNKTITLNCFCINTEFTVNDYLYLKNNGLESNFSRLKCHGQILAYYFFDNY